MTDDEQRIAIAEACGWNPAPCSEGVWRAPDNTHHDKIPDYLSDMNAMHEAVFQAVEQSGHAFQAAFAFYLQTVVERRRRGLSREQIAFWTQEATAAQRAEAFLRTIGRWKPQ